MAGATILPHASAAQVSIIRGAAATGKTEELARRAAALLSAGVAPASIGVFASTPDACAALAERLRAIAGTADVPEVLTAAEYELRILGAADARHGSGGTPHVMLRFEENIFMEDMKTCGVIPRRLAGMLKFFYRSACDLEQMEASWFYNTEEENAYKMLLMFERYYGAYVRQMVPFHAYRAVQDFANVRESFAFDHVLIDDYQLLSKASQCLLGSLARQTLTVAADGAAKVTAFEEYPYPAGIDELTTTNPDAQITQLTCSFAAPTVSSAIARLMADEAISADAPSARTEENTAEGGFALLSFDDPVAELDGVAAKAAELIAEGIPANRIAIACPKPIWERNAAKALHSAGVPVAMMQRPNISGDVRSLDASFEARIVTLLKLLANPADPLALRCWCGFGDYLANSALFTGMARAGVRVELDTAKISTTGSEDALFVQQRDRILNALEEARVLLPQLRGLTGTALIAGAAKLLGRGKEPGAGFVRAFGPIAQDADAAALVAALERNVNFPRFVGDGVHVGLTCDFCGLRPQVVIMIGMVNGMTPAQEYFDPTRVERDKRPAQLAHEAAKIYAAAGKADNRLLASYFTSAPLVESEHLQLKVDRVRFADGIRRTDISPSETIRAWTGVRFND